MKTDQKANRLPSTSGILAITWIAIFVLCSCKESYSDQDADANTKGETGTNDAGQEADTGSGQTSDAGNGKKSDSGIKPSSEKIGGFDIRLVPPVEATNTQGFTSVIGKINDAPLLSMIIWELVEEQEGCQLFEPRIPFCDPSCTNAVCVEDDTCTPNPNTLNVGTVVIKGVETQAGANQITMEPMPPINVYQATESLLYPPFAEGDEVRLEASGGGYASFVITSHGISPLELLSDDEIPAVREQPIVVEWKPPNQKEISRIHAIVDISHHGGVKGKIECDVADTGLLEIPESLVTQLIDLGYAGFPTIDIIRTATGSIEIKPGRIELTVTSSEVRGLQIPGLISCTENDQCPSGQTCQQDLRCM